MESICIINKLGTKRWKLANGKLHREDGPAIIWTCGDEAWWLNDIQYYNIKNMPLNLFLAYCKWEYKKNGK